MPANVLIAYTTRSGSTREVAEAIEGELREAGVLCELAPMRQLPSPAGHSAAVLGVPLYMGHLLKEFHRFVEGNRDSLQNMPVWCFVLGPVENKPEQFAEARRQAETQLARHKWLRPVELRVFGGCWDVRRMNFPMSLLRFLPASKISTMDVRDWEATRAWAREIAGQMDALPGWAGRI
jgi:menaquinone-dependent protoporphyrinogen oxidase